MSSKSLLQIWCKRVEKNSVGLLLVPLQFENLTFETIPPAGSSASIQRKRQRPLSDVDGELSTSKKKRRLRRYLITSRLSPAFSSPATYIYDGGIKSTAFARKSTERGAIWKAAMVNRCRLRRLAAQQVVEQQPRQRATLTPTFGRRRPTLRPSPLGQSHYIARDLEFDEDGDGGAYVEESEYDSDDESGDRGEEDRTCSLLLQGSSRLGQSRP